MSGIRVFKNIIAGIKDNQYWEQIDANKAYCPPQAKFG